MKKEFIQKKEPQKANFRFAFWGVFLVFFSVYFLLFTNNVSAATLTKAPNNLGLVGYWSFNEGAGTQAGDFSGNGNTGTISGATWTDGRFGKALDFDGTDDFVSLPSGCIVPASGSFTISGWVKPRAITGATRIFSQGVNSCTRRSALVFSSSKIQAFLTTLSDAVVPVAATDVLVTDEWQHFLWTFNGTTHTLYINGSVSDSIKSASVFGLEGDTYFGRRGTGNYLNGLLDDWRIYNRVLSASEISSLYNSGSVRRSTPTNLGLIAHWSFNEGSGTQAGDFSGTGNHGTLQSFSEPPTATSGWGSGKFGGGLNFDGTNDYISTTIQYTNPNPFTISGWFKTTSASGRKIIGFENTQTGTGGSQYDRHIYMGTDGKIYFGWYPGSPATVASTNALNDGQWHHFLATHNGSTGQLFIDGVSQGTNTGAPQSYSGYWRLGGFKLAAWTNAGDGYFVGAVDDVRIYNRVLSAEERAVLFRAGGETKVNTTPTNFLTDGLVGHWTFDGKDMNWTTGTLSDKSPQGNNGQVVNMSTTTTPTIGKIGQAFSFNGSNSRITLGDVLNIDLPVTISAWINTNTTSVDKGIFTNDRSSGSYTGFWFQINSDGTIGINYGDNTGTGAANRRSKRSLTTISQSTWHHVVGVIRAATDMDLYIDGVDAGGTYSGTGGAMVNTTKTGLIGDIGGSMRFDGSIDEIRVYNRTLSASEVQQLYLMGK